MTRIYTVGYEGLRLQELILSLQANGIKALIDIREYPVSRKPGFSKRALSQALCRNGIGYEHWQNLGAPRGIRQALKQTGDWQVYSRDYLELLGSLSGILRNLAVRAEQTTLCLLCFERDYRECHRSLVTGELERLQLINDTKHLSPRRDQAAVAA